MDYLSQLLGQNCENLKSFVDDVEKFQRGEPVPVSFPSTAIKTIENSNQKQRQSEDYSKEAEAVKKNARKQEGRTKPKRVITPKNTGSSAVATIANHPPIASSLAIKTKKTIDPSVLDESKSSVKQPATKQSLEPTKQATELRYTRSIPTQHGTPESRVCGCYGTLHKPLTNCLSCGRISCTLEGYDYCHFCGYLVSPPTIPQSNSGEASISSSWLLKERLLRYDRELQQRTKVVDDQEDYYSNTTSTWLTEDEKRNAHEKVQRRQEELTHSGKKQVLNLQF